MSGITLKTRLLLIVVSIVAFSPLQALAHHSTAPFDRTKTVTLSGFLKEYQYTNPHCWIIIAVIDPTGTIPQGTLYGIEGYSPLSMSRWGLLPSTLKAGDRISVTFHPLRDGEHGGSIIAVTLGDGKHIQAGTGG